ncbi:MAG TPA: SDR family NAD(P)-dependent oxidoreductase [Roseiarcus sp.]|nr:SDR family NAD(P)-dependent oxidoreductase [Roseiarcus sp.]
MPTSSPSTAVIIGASRGLGLALVEEYLKRGWRVVATVRGSHPTNLHDLRDRSAGRLEIETVDVVKPETIAALRQRLAARRFDVLFVVAGVGSGPSETIATVSTEEFNRVMMTNALGPMRVVEALESLVSPNGVIGVMSSGLGSVANNASGGWEVYRASKAALNTLMRSFAARHASDRRGFVIIAPGWVRTDMGGPNAPLSVEDSIPGVVDAIASQAGRSDLRFLDRTGREVPW